MTSDTLIDQEMKRRGLKPETTKLGQVKKIGKGFAGFLGGAAKGFASVAAEGGRFIKKEVKSEIDTELKSRRAFTEARRKAKIAKAKKDAFSRYGLKTEKRKKKGKKLKIFNQELY